MKFGLFGGARARGGPAGDSYAYHDFINYVVEAERLGFSSGFLVEHHFTGVGPVSASMTFLRFFAARTDELANFLGCPHRAHSPWHRRRCLALAQPDPRRRAGGHARSPV